MKSTKGKQQQCSVGSGVFVDPTGIVLTNAHVANPDNLPLKQANRNLIELRVTFQTDTPPVPSYWAKILVEDTSLDLSVLQVVKTMRGVPASQFSFPYIRMADSDSVEIGDRIGIVGYPTIGGKTVTFTSGRVAGFNEESKLKLKRGWIKTDAVISGGNSGGAAINQQGELIGIPTQVSAGSDVFPIDIRPLVDSDNDGILDLGYVVGGFINGLRPVNLVKPLLKDAGVF